MDIKKLEKIKRISVAALVADDILMGIIVLKGGNALNIAYNISNRGSVDIDFSIEKDFSDREKERLKNQFDHILNAEFIKYGYIVFDVKFNERPNTIDDAVKYFWGGYLLEFKIIEADKNDDFNGDLDSIRRNAVVVGNNNSTKFTIDISKYEYVGRKKPIDIDGSVVYVYTPEMIVLEKLRAICQQIPEYKEVVKRMTSNPRARDFFDIHSLISHFNIDFTSEENVELTRVIFDAKKVPLEFVSLIPEYRDFHKEDWASVEQTVNQDEEIKEFDYYFDFVLAKFKHLIL